MASLICVCGGELGNIPGELIDTSSLTVELIADIDEEIEVFVQKCSACGALNFSVSMEEPVKMCWNCHKARIATVAPVKYVSDEPANNMGSIATGVLESAIEINNTNSFNLQSSKVSSYMVNDGDDDDDDDDGASPWMNLLGGIKSATGGLASEKCEVIAPQPKDVVQVFKPTVNDDDDDVVDAGNWGSLLGGNMQIKTEPQVVTSKNELTIIAVRYGQLSYTIKKTDVPLLLGRDAKLKEFLVHDQRVSNEHLYIDYENNNWIVRDNNSSNGTAVNSKDIGYGGKKVLQNGDLLKLGHHLDSMEFKVLIE
jgi:hypothetical protein